MLGFRDGNASQCQMSAQPAEVDRPHPTPSLIPAGSELAARDSGTPLVAPAIFFKKSENKIGLFPEDSIYMLYMTIVNDLKRIQQRIAAIQGALAQLGPLRPGCLSRQYRDPQRKKGSYYQLSYTAQMKSRTEYIPPELVPQIQQELAEYRRYRQLTQEWVQLSIHASRLKIQPWKQTTRRQPPTA